MNVTVATTTLAHVAEQCCGFALASEAREGSRYLFLGRVMARDDRGRGLNSRRHICGNASHDTTEVISVLRVGGTAPIVEMRHGLALSGSMRKEIADSREWRTGFGRPSNLAFENMVERNFAIQGLVEVVAVHADDALASDEGR